MKKKYSHLMIGFFLFLHFQYSFGQELQSLLKQLESKLGVLLQKLQALPKGPPPPPSPSPSPAPPEKKDIAQDPRYKTLAKLPDLQTISEADLKRLSEVYNQLMTELNEGKFTQDSMPNQITAAKTKIEQELEKRRKKPEKSSVSEDQKYRVLKSAIQELQNIGSVSDSRLKQLLNTYTDLEDDIKKGDFKEMRMPTELANVKSQVEQELDRRKASKTVPPETFDTATMNEDQFENFEEALDEEYKKYKRIDLNTVDLNILEKIKAQITAWKKDKRREKSRDRGYGQFLIKVFDEIKSRKEKITPEQKLEQLTNEIKEKIEKYKPEDSQWAVKKGTIKKGIDPMTGTPREQWTVSDYENPLSRYVVMFNEYFKQLSEQQKNPESQISNFINRTFYDALGRALTMENYTQQINDPYLRSYLEYEDEKAIFEKMKWLRFINQAKQLFNYVNKAIPGAIGQLYEKVVKDLKEGFKPKLDVYYKKSEWTQDDKNRVNQLINQYEGFLSLINETDPLVDELKDRLNAQQS